MPQGSRVKTNLTAEANPKRRTHPVWDGGADGVTRVKPGDGAVQEVTDFVLAALDDGPLSQFELAHMLQKLMPGRSQRWAETKVSASLCLLRRAGEIESVRDKPVRRRPKDKPFFSPEYRLV